MYVYIYGGNDYSGPFGSTTNTITNNGTIASFGKSFSEIALDGGDNQSTGSVTNTITNNGVILNDSNSSAETTIGGGSASDNGNVTNNLDLGGVLNTTSSNGTAYTQIYGGSANRRYPR